MAKYLTCISLLSPFVIMALIIYYTSPWNLAKLTQTQPNSEESLREENTLIDTLIFLTTLPFKDKTQQYSSYSKDGIIKALLKKIKAKYKYFVEFNVKNSRKYITRFLQELGWQGLLMDKKNENISINLHKETIHYRNIVSLFKKYSVPKYFDVLSIDCGMKDYWILRSIHEAGYRPRIIIGKVNHAIPPPFSITVPKEDDAIANGEEYTNNASEYKQYSFTAAWKLAREFGYSMIYCDQSRKSYFLVVDGSEGFGEGFCLSDYLKVSDLYHPKGGKMRTMKDINPMGLKWIEV